MSDPFRIVPAGDAAVILELGDRIDPVVNERAVSVAQALDRLSLPGVRDVVPTFKSVAVYFDPLKTDIDGLTRCLGDLGDEARNATGTARTGGPIVRVPVCYGGEYGPDLAEVARFAGTNVAQVIALHAGQTYRVFMLGFLPGFAYMASVHPRIAAPRRESPRLRVPTGSVGIAGQQTGIYPSDSPGGWCLIGRTPLRPYDPGRAAPFLFKAGDRVQFDPIGPEQYETWPHSA
jgi:inhibitor of KinA